jgi:hypothetical protein
VARNKKKHKEWRAKNRDKIRTWGRRQGFLQRLKRYGLTEVEYDAMWVAQGCRCKSCGCISITHKKGWCIDHNHATGHVRGIICAPCNIMAGHAKDVSAHLRLVADYLDRNVT